MKRFGLIVVALLLLFTLAACGGDEGESASVPAAQAADMSTAESVGADAAPMGGDAAAGQQIFATTCAACHGPAGEGVQGLGKDMTSSEFIAGLSDEELIAFIKDGRRIGDPLNTTGVDMPPKGGNPALSDEQLMDIIAYMRSIHK